MGKEQIPFPMGNDFSQRGEDIVTSFLDENTYRNYIPGCTVDDTLYKQAIEGILELAGPDILARAQIDTIWHTALQNQVDLMQAEVDKEALFEERKNTPFWARTVAQKRDYDDACSRERELETCIRNNWQLPEYSSAADEARTLIGDLAGTFGYLDSTTRASKTPQYTPTELRRYRQQALNVAHGFLHYFDEMDRERGGY